MLNVFNVFNGLINVTNKLGPLLLDYGEPVWIRQILEEVYDYIFIGQEQPIDLSFVVPVWQINASITYSC